MSRLPSLNALKAFDAAARHLSFTRGAESLHVTQSAISHQVRLLEAQIGKPLFDRMPSELRLTDAGHTLYRSVHEAFGIIMSAADELRNPPRNEIVTVALRPFLSFNWLSQRLSGFYEKYPDIKIRLDHTNGDVDPQNTEADIAIVLGDGEWPGLHTEFLMPCELTPVCSPKVFGEEKKPQRLSDLNTDILLHERTYGNWPRWFELSGETGLGTRRHVFIDDTNVRIQAAINGQGIALSNPKLLSAEFDAGNLVAPFDAMLTDRSYFVVCRKKPAASSTVRILRDWLVEEAA